MSSTVSKHGEVQHTPLPWESDPEGELAVSIEGGDGSVVCDVHGASDDPLCEANCDLICRAVNSHADLLEACKRALADIERHNADCKGKCDWDFADGFGGAPDILRAAIAKAVQP